MAEAPGWSRSPPLGGGKERGEEGGREGKRGEEGQSQFTFLFESDNPDCRGNFPPFVCISISETLSILILRILLGENENLLLGR